jgi:hypothetical protein
MKKLAFGALCTGLIALAACGGGGGDNVDTNITRIDGGGGTLVCDVVNNTGCDAGEKCTWVRVSVGTEPEQQLGQVNCVPDGDVPTGSACMFGASGLNTGYDNCVGGNLCMAPRTTENAMGTCKEICSLMDTSNPCPEFFACGPYQKTFTNNSEDDPLAGICDSTCNPLTQVRDSDGAPSCGDATPDDQTDAGSLACYGLPSRTTRPTHFSCTGIIDEDPSMDGIQNDNIHRVAPSILCLNCCAPGNVPLYIESDTVTETVCFAYCQPTIINNVTTDPDTGDPAVASGVPPYDCPAMGALEETEECRYLWFFEGLFTEAEVPLTAASDAFGFCWDPTKYTWNDDGDTNTPEVAWPRCADMEPSPATVGPTSDYFWGCTSSDNAPPTVAPSSRLPTIRPFLSSDDMNARAREWFSAR